MAIKNGLAAIIFATVLLTPGCSHEEHKDKDPNTTYNTPEPQSFIILGTAVASAALYGTYHLLKRKK